jgi:hypothetical protein
MVLAFGPSLRTQVFEEKGGVVPMSWVRLLARSTILQTTAGNSEARYAQGSSIPMMLATLAKYAKATKLDSIRM